MPQPAKPILLFVYGTLHPERAPREIAAVARRLKLLGPAIIRGRLLDLGEYPGLLLDESQTVAGELFQVPDPNTLAALDRYEDFRPDDPEVSLFLRVQAHATLPNGRTQMCWVYLYNR